MYKSKLLMSIPNQKRTAQQYDIPDGYYLDQQEFNGDPNDQYQPHFVQQAHQQQINPYSNLELIQQVKDIGQPHHFNFQMNYPQQNQSEKNQSSQIINTQAMTQVLNDFYFYFTSLIPVYNVLQNQITFPMQSHQKMLQHQTQNGHFPLPLPQEYDNQLFLNSFNLQQVNSLYIDKLTQQSNNLQPYLKKQFQNNPPDMPFLLGETRGQKKSKIKEKKMKKMIKDEENEPKFLEQNNELQQKQEDFGYYDQPKDGDEIRKLLFDNTLTGYVLKIFEIHQQVPLTESYVVEQVRANMHHLKRPDGTKYKGNLYKTVKGSLTSNGIFRKTTDVGETFWIVNKESAHEFEKRTVQRILHLADKRKFLQRNRNQKNASVDDPIQGEEHQLFQESQSLLQNNSSSITNKYSHVYNLLDGFIRSQKDNKHLREVLDQTETLQINQADDFQQFQKITDGYSIKDVLEGIHECYGFFSQLFDDTKMDDVNLYNEMKI